MAVFHVDGGFDFHQAFFDLPEGSFQLVWEVNVDQMEPVEIIRNYRAAIDDITIALKTCAQLRTLKNWYHTFPGYWCIYTLTDFVSIS